jgi:hypothetical protein
VRTPGFTAEFSVYKSVGHYRRPAPLNAETIFSDFVPQYQPFLNSPTWQYATMPAPLGCPRPTCPSGEVCCGGIEECVCNGDCCKPPGRCCEDVCCPPGNPCCNGTCCNPGQVCCGTLCCDGCCEGLCCMGGSCCGNVCTSLASDPGIVAPVALSAPQP